ncbi:FUSC family protein [Microbacterium trichothecenolyticum]|uniref:FUSC family protein n=1 Tax=Microbacterium trichothecenolyticum TaxID=69370 RepID=UPI001C6EDFB1|nr:FUSC family protein [Microbacterium trichothecenolyticum]MBW9120888.1 FUSC family protein [Microbacterium trichothecenolyticum]
MSGDGETAAITQVVPTGWRARLDLRPQLTRVRGSALAILQITVAATAAWGFAHYVVGHPAPLLAATVTITSLGLVRDARPRRVLETVVGMLVGILVAEGFVVVVGPGWWQLALALGVTLLVARFLSPYPPFAIMAGVQACIVMSLPATEPFSRLIDGAVGGIAALAVTALIPRNPRREEARDGHAVFAAADAAARTIVQALRRGDPIRAARGLEKARAIAPRIDEWRASLDSGLAVAAFSPWLRPQRAELRRHHEVLQAMDFATRNLRVVARRAVYLCDDGQRRPVQAEVLAELMRAAELVGESLDDIALQPAAREAVRAVAVRLDPAAILPDASQGEQNLITAMRPLAVDLLTATGMSSAAARAVLPRV